MHKKVNCKKSRYPRVTVTLDTFQYKHLKILKSVKTTDKASYISISIDSGTRETYKRIWEK